jgi:hypothetical protein
MKHSDDLTIFAWSAPQELGSLALGGLLAGSPACFSNCGNVVVLRDTRLKRKLYSVTNKGLLIDLPLISWNMETYVGVLACGFSPLYSLPRGVEPTRPRRIGIYLQLLDDDDEATRVPVGSRDMWDSDPETYRYDPSDVRDIYVRQYIWALSDSVSGFRLDTLPLQHGPDRSAEEDVWPVDVVSPTLEVERRRCLRTPPGIVARQEFPGSRAQTGTPGCDWASMTGLTPLSNLTVRYGAVYQKRTCRPAEARR